MAMHTTRTEDDSIRQAGTLTDYIDDLVAIIERLDSELDTALDRIEALEKEKEDAIS